MNKAADLLKQAQIGARLLQMRTSKQWTRAEVKRRTGIDRLSIANYERGLTAIPAVRLQRFADLYGVTYQWLLTGLDSQVESTEFQKAMQLFVEAGAKFIEAGDLLKGK